MSHHLRRTALAWGIVGLITTGCLASPDPAPSASAAPQAHGWQPLPESPLGARSDAHAFWTGERVLVIGGGGGQPCPPNADCDVPVRRSVRRRRRLRPVDRGMDRDRAGADPARGNSAARSCRTCCTSSSTGRSRDRRSAAFLAYHLRDDRWVELEAPPIEGNASVALVAAGDRVVALSPDPGAAGWRGPRSTTLRPMCGLTSRRPPLARAFDRSAVWTGRELLMVSLDLVDQPNSARPSLYRAAALDLGAGTWRRLPDSEVLGWSPTWFWSGDRLVNPAIGSADGGEVNNFGRAFPFGGIFDVGSGAWSTLPDPPAVANVLQGVSVGGPEDVVSSEGFVLACADTDVDAAREATRRSVRHGVRVGGRSTLRVGRRSIGCRRRGRPRRRVDVATLTRRSIDRLCRYGPWRCEARLATLLASSPRSRRSQPHRVEFLCLPGEARRRRVSLCRHGGVVASRSSTTAVSPAATSTSRANPGSPARPTR